MTDKANGHSDESMEEALERGMDEADRRREQAEIAKASFRMDEPAKQRTYELEAPTAAVGDKMIMLVLHKLTEIAARMPDLADLSVSMNETREGRELCFRAYRMRSGGPGKA